MYALRPHWLVITATDIVATVAVGVVVPAPMVVGMLLILLPPAATPRSTQYLHTQQRI